MKILVITYGSRGDVQPYVALARGLSRAGHQVTLATSERFRSFIERHGITYGFMSDDLLAMIDTPQGKELLENSTGVFQIIRQNIKLSKKIKPLTVKLMRDSWHVAEDVKPDYIIYHPKAAAAPHIAEKLNIGCALATPIPMFIPTSEFPFLVLPDLKLGGWYNRLSYHIINRLTVWFLKDPVATFRSDIGLPKLQRLNPLKSSNGDNIPVLHCYSEAVVPRPSDWPESAYVTGYWFLDEETGWQPPRDLADFLDAGDPPVYFGFGSMAGRNPARLAGIVVESLKATGLRGIIATGWGGLKVDDLPPTIHKIENAPHDWLFPRVAAVVHHGGAGTTAAGLRAGKPTIIVPFMGDQPFWGKRLNQLGVSPKPIPQKQLTIERLSSALQEVTSNPTLGNAAMQIGQAIKSEDGIAIAVGLIDQLSDDGNAKGGD